VDDGRGGEIWRESNRVRHGDASLLSHLCFGWDCHGPSVSLPVVLGVVVILAMQMLSCALYEVATRPEYIKPLRDEVEAVVAREGWNKDSISKLYKMDSFFREIHRCYDLNIRKIFFLSRIGVFVF
jgi:hypothetical protein